MVFGNPENALDLWLLFVDQFIDTRNITSEHERNVRINRALLYINERLEEYGLFNDKKGLPMPDSALVEEVTDQDVEEFFFPNHIGSDPTDLTAPNTQHTIDFYHTLNSCQKSAIDIIERAVGNEKTSKLFFLHGSGGILLSLS